jgi:hypothetical protein
LSAKAAVLKRDNAATTTAKPKLKFHVDISILENAPSSPTVISGIDSGGKWEGR